MILHSIEYIVNICGAISSRWNGLLSENSDDNHCDVFFFSIIRLIKGEWVKEKLEKKIGFIVSNRKVYERLQWLLNSTSPLRIINMRAGNTLIPHSRLSNEKWLKILSLLPRKKKNKHKTILDSFIFINFTSD